MKKGQNLPIKRKLRIRLFTSLFVYTFTGFIVLMLFQSITTFGNPVVEWLYWRLDVIYFFYLMIGLNAIFYVYWKKPWDYLEEVLDAAQTVYEQNDRSIELSEPLHEVEKQMNQIKMSVLVSQQAAREAEERKNELVMYLAHDIRTPLTTVIGYLSMLEEAPDMPAEQRAKYTGIALEKAERLETLINELFEITRYHTSKVQLKKSPVDLYALLSQVLDDFYPVLSEKGNTAQIFAEDDLTIPGDAQKLARVFNNLLKNAAAYSDPHTKIRISADRKENCVIVSFQNHGPDIPPDQLSTVFEKFSRLDEARASDTGGAGLGLSIAREIVRLHGGEITAQSRDGVITFIVMLPSSD